MTGTSEALREAEIALRRLGAARPQERNPKACKGCSRTHRKCSFQEGQTRCDQCIRHDKECVFPPTPASLGDMQRRSSDDRIPIQGAGAPPQLPPYPHRTPSRASSSAYPHPVVNTRYSQSQPLHSYGQESQYHHLTNSSPTVPSHGQYSRYPTDAGHNYRHHTGEPNGYYVPSQGPLPPQNSAYGQAHWNETQMAGGDYQHHQPLNGNNYGNSFSGNAPPMPMLRGTSAHSMAQGHTDPGQSYARLDSGYYTQSPAHEGHSYGMDGHAVYQHPMPPTEAASPHFNANGSGGGY